MEEQTRNTTPPETITSPTTSPLSPALDTNIPSEESSRPSIFLWIFTILSVCCFVGLTVYVAIKKLSPTGEDTYSEEVFIESNKNLSTIITDSEDENSAKKNIGEFLSSISNEKLRKDLEISSIYYYMIGKYQGAALSELLDISLDGLSEEQSCRYYDVRYILAKNTHDSLEEEYLLERDDICSAILLTEKFLRSPEETPLAYADRLYSAGFYSLAIEKYSRLKLSSLSSEEKVHVYTALAEYYNATNDEEKYYSTLNEKLKITNPEKEEDYDGLPEFRASENNIIDKDINDIIE